MAKNNEQLPVILNTEAVSELLGISQQTVRIQCMQGELPATKLGRRWYVSRDRLFACLNENGGKEIAVGL